MNELLIATVEAALKRAGIDRPGSVLLVALSGGADSVALLRAVSALGSRRGFQVCAAHVEHGLRGEASLADARFCEALCGELRVPLTVDHARLTGGMETLGAEARAREARYALLLRRARECRADALLLAHHQEDQAETVLAHLIRGSGARGLSGMREAAVREGVLLMRPLLGLSRQTLLDALDGAPYRVDETNFSPCCQRNRIRGQVMPLLRQENPHAAAHMAQSAALLALDADCLETQADAWLRAALIDDPPFFCVRRALLSGAPPALALRALRGFVGRGLARLEAKSAPLNATLPMPPGASETPQPPSVTAYAPADGCLTRPAEADGNAFDEHALSAGDSLALLELLRASENAALNLPHDLCAVATAHYVHLVRMADGAPLCDTPQPEPLPLTGAPDTLCFGALVFHCAPELPGRDPPPDGVRSVVVPDALLPRLNLRTARPGDRIHPFGAVGGKTLRRYFMDRKVDLPFRPRVPLLCMEDQVLWAVGLGASEVTRAGHEPATRVTVTGALYWQAEPPSINPPTDPV